MTNKEDENIYGKGITDSEFRNLIIMYLLGNDWYIVDPIAQTQVNEVALNEILYKYLNKKQLNKILNKPYKNFIKGE